MINSVLRLDKQQAISKSLLLIHHVEIGWQSFSDKTPISTITLDRVRQL